MAPSGCPGIGQRASSSSTRSVPNSRNAVRFSSGIALDRVAEKPYPRALDTSARPIPVFPDVGSTRFSRLSPRSSASRMRLAATRSFTAPNGLYHSSLAYTFACRNSGIRRSRTIGVGFSTLDSRSRIES